MKCCSNIISVKKRKLLIFLLIVGMILISGCIRTPDKNELMQKFSEFKMKSNETQSQGYNVTEADEFIKKARQAFDKSDYKIANDFLDKAFGALEKAQKIQSRQASVDSTRLNKEEARKRLSAIKVASQYRRVTDGVRSLDDVIDILKTTHTDFVYQGWMRQNPCPERCSDLSPDKREACEQQGYSYEYLRNATIKIKMEIPDIIFGGGFLAEFLSPDSWNESTGEAYGRDRIWGMALDPNKWGISKSKDEFQTEWAIQRGWAKQGQSYNPKEEMYYYYPDLTNPGFKELMLGWAKKQIDSGVDALWIDMLYVQPDLLNKMTGDVNHTAVKESYEAASDIIDEIHKYGISKGKNVFVISWAMPIMLEVPYPEPDLDALMLTVGSGEIRAMKLNENKWDTAIQKVREKFGDVPIFARIDYGNTGSPLSVFSQLLTKDQANQFLRIADEFFQQKGIIFIYPVHGGNMGGLKTSSKILSFGNIDWYDSLAPEFQTFNTIEELSIKKSNQEG